MNIKIENKVYVMVKGHCSVLVKGSAPKFWSRANPKHWIPWLIPKRLRSFKIVRQARAFITAEDGLHDNTFWPCSSFLGQLLAIPLYHDNYGLLQSPGSKESQIFCWFSHFHVVSSEYTNRALSNNHASVYNHADSLTKCKRQIYIYKYLPTISLTL